MTEDETAKSLQSAIYREKVERARRMTPLQKFEAGQELFEAACQQMLGNIRGQMPKADRDALRLELRRRLAIGRRLDDLQLERTFRA